MTDQPYQLPPRLAAMQQIRDAFRVLGFEAKCLPDETHIFGADGYQGGYVVVALSDECEGTELEVRCGPCTSDGDRRDEPRADVSIRTNAFRYLGPDEKPAARCPDCDNSTTNHAPDCPTRSSPGEIFCPACSEFVKPKHEGSRGAQFCPVCSLCIDFVEEPAP